MKPSLQQLFEILWDNAEEVLPGGGRFSDTFIGPNKILREGIFDIELSDKYEGIKYRAVITLGKLIPVKDKRKEAGSTGKLKAKAA